MADTKISALPAVSSLAAADEFPVNEAGTTKKGTLTQLNAFLGNTLDNFSVTGQSISATTAYVTGSSILVPSGLLQVGTFFKWRFSATKTAAGTTAGCAIIVKVGTLGTTGDTSLLTFTMGTPTGVVDTAMFDVMAVVRTIGAGTSAVMGGVMSMSHNLSATGFSTLPGETIRATSAGFNSTTASLIVGLTITTTALSVWSVEDLTVTVNNL